MRTYSVTITGKTPLLMHRDDIEHADAMERWKNDPANRKDSKAGDDRSPAWRWLGGLYHDGTRVAVPSDNLMRCLMEAGAMVPVPGGKNGKTFKSQTQSGCMVGEPYWPMLVRGKEIAMSDLKCLASEPSFDKHQTLAAKLGFMLYVKRAKIGASKHIRVRARFDEWSASGTINAWDDQLTIEILRQILTFGGQYKGIGDWRPGGKTPGPHGMFGAEISEA